LKGGFLIIFTLSLLISQKFIKFANHFLF